MGKYFKKKHKAKLALQLFHNLEYVAFVSIFCIEYYMYY